MTGALGAGRSAGTEVPRGRILVVDDEPTTRALFARTLREARYETLEAADGVEALALNVSPALVHTDPEIGPLLSRADRPVILELTEHAPIDDYRTLQGRINAIEPPVQIAVDDAGSGYASLRHILALRPDYVKLDLSWVRGIDTEQARQALVAGLVHFAGAMGCELIGEGIETQAERSTLERLGVRYGQAYLLGRPEDGRGPGPWPTKVNLQGFGSARGSR